MLYDVRQHTFLFIQHILIGADQSSTFWVLETFQDLVLLSGKSKLFLKLCPIEIFRRRRQTLIWLSIVAKGIDPNTHCMRHYMWIIIYCFFIWHIHHVQIIGWRLIVVGIIAGRWYVFPRLAKTILCFYIESKTRQLVFERTLRNQLQFERFN